MQVGKYKMLRGNENIGNTKEFTQSLMDVFDFFFLKEINVSEVKRRWRLFKRKM